MKTVVIIPCFNEQTDIGSIVAKAKQYVDEVVVVDNGSYDNTVIEAKKAGATVLYSHRQGMGAAIKIGIKSVKADIYITMDGDGQHNPDEIPSLVNPVRDGSVDIAVGVRKNCNMPTYRKFGNDILRDIYNFGSKDKLEDVQCGFRAFNQRITHLPIKSHGFGCVFELLVKARKAKLLIKPVIVSCVYFKDLKHNSTLNPIKHGLIAISGAIRWRLWELF